LAIPELLVGPAAQSVTKPAKRADPTGHIPLVDLRRNRKRFAVA
jgi:hypothetical protein